MRSLSKASCVVVCWTPDAFAPEDGSEVSWVEAEASIARERKVIVPIMLERVPLKAPWNMFHTERMMDWPAGAHDYPAWQSMLEAIGRNLDRPGLAEYALALAGRRRWLHGPRSTRTIRWQRLPLPPALSRLSRRPARCCAVPRG